MSFTNYLPDVATSGVGYLTTYTPLCALTPGRLAVVKHILLPFEDASCRQEPDLSHPLAPITAVCRGHLFVPRLRPGAVVVYMTKKLHGGYYLTGALKVVKTYADQSAHADVANLCREMGLELPGNCLVRDNPPLGLDFTGGQHGEVRRTLAALEANRPEELAAIIRRWDVGYRKRVRKTPNVALCRPHFVELREPPIVSVEELNSVFGRVPATRNPKQVDLELLNILLTAKGIAAIG